MGYVLFNFVFNIVCLYVIKELSGSVVLVQNTVRLPIVIICFHFTFIMGEFTEPWNESSYYVFGGLALIIAGLIFYMMDAVRKEMTQEKPEPCEYEDEKPLLCEDVMICKSSSAKEIPYAVPCHMYNDPLLAESI